MAAGIALSKADVVLPGEGTAEGVAVLVRAGTATLRKGRAVLVERAGVTTVVRSGRRQWTVAFTDGTEWVVARKGGCGCGGG